MKIRGNTVGTPMKRSDFNQTNPKKSDYIKNNPFSELGSEDEGKILVVKDGKLVAIPNSTTDGRLEIYLDLIDKEYGGTSGLAYEISEDGTYAICVGLGDAPEGSCIEIASYYRGVPVTEIGCGAFNNKTLSAVHIPPTITKFASGAFTGVSVDEVYITDIVKWASILVEDEFTLVGDTTKVYVNYRYVTDLVLPKCVAAIKDNTFVGWKQLKSVVVPDTVTKIGYLAFGDSGLESVIIEGVPSEIGFNAFAGCTALKDIFVYWSKGDSVDANASFESSATVWYYRESEPNDEGDFWHYVDGKPKAWAPVYKETQGLAYVKDNWGQYPVCVGIGSVTDKSTIVIPDIPDSYSDPVKTLGVNAFANTPNVTTVVLPPSFVTAMGGSLSSPSIKKVVCTTSKYLFDGDSLYANMFSSPDNSSGYGGCTYVNDGAKAFVKCERMDIDDSTMYVSQVQSSNTTLEELHVPWGANHEWMNANRPWGLENATIIYESEESLK